MGDEMFQPSMSQEDMYKEMTTDLSNAAKVLPNEQGGGRFTKGAALTLKAWIDLYWGDIIKDPRPSSIFPADPQKALDAYKACAETCQEIMGLGVYDLMPTREDAFKEENNNCKEQVLHISVIKLSLNHVEVKSLGLIMRRQVLPVIISERVHLLRHWWICMG